MVQLRYVPETQPMDVKSLKEALEDLIRAQSQPFDLTNY